MFLTSHVVTMGALPACRCDKAWKAKRWCNSLEANHGTGSTMATTAHSTPTVPDDNGWVFVGRVFFRSLNEKWRIWKYNNGRGLLIIHILITTYSNNHPKLNQTIGLKT